MMVQAAPRQAPPDSTMASNRLDPELPSAAFKRFGSIQRLGPDRSGHASIEHVRHQLFVGQDLRTRANALIKVLTKPGLVYDHNLTRSEERRVGKECRSRGGSYH